jgi:hypothetical protein
MKYEHKKMRVLLDVNSRRQLQRHSQKGDMMPYSCDVLPTEGNPEWHIQGEVLDVIDEVGYWDISPTVHVLSQFRSATPAQRRVQMGKDGSS